MPGNPDIPPGFRLGWLVMRRGFAGVPLLVTLLLAVLLLPACTDTPPSPPPPTTQPTTTRPPTPTPTATPPPRPPDAPTAKSAASFVRYFWETFNYANATLEPSPLQAISADDCLFCTSAVDVVLDLAAQHKQVTGGTVTANTVVVPPGDLESGVVVTTVISQSPAVTRNTSGETSETPGTRKMRSLVSLDWTGRRWQVRDVANDEKTGTPW